VICVSAEGFDALGAVEGDVVVVGWFEEEGVEVWIETEVGGGEEAEVDDYGGGNFLIANLSVS